MVQVSSQKHISGFYFFIFLIAKFDEIGLRMIASLLATLQKWKTYALDVNGCITQWFFSTNFVIFQKQIWENIRKMGFLV
jgi:hypothetical protein